jgi:hypothetical protein
LFGGAVNLGADFLVHFAEGQSAQCLDLNGAGATSILK